MVGTIRALIKSYRAMRLWNKSIDSATRRNYDVALVRLRAFYRLFDAEMPSDRVMCDVNVFCANIACKTGNYDLAVSAGTVALRQMSGRIAGLSGYDKDYLRYYCKSVLTYCERNGKVLCLPSDLWPVGISFESLRPETVRSDLVRNFPV